ncbi:hypothetical protein [Micromonospora sp. MA102]|uniref:hypothetical protein n=1 Tax=Micromonospora sp. MA102 TaxID=2952755 RepID=UPI0021C5A380|nr:hypothetical protein [Micromonospora sp. MA102]
MTETLRRIDEDPSLAHRFGCHRAELGGCLRELLREALAGRSGSEPVLLLELQRRLRVTQDEFDAFGHHLLTAVLAQQLGPEVLVRVGAALTTARRRLVGEPPVADAASRRNVRARNGASRRYRVSGPPAHLPRPPDWRCSGCAHEWPCPTKQSQLLAEFGGTTAGLAVYLGTCLVAATRDLPTLPLAQARARFLGWLPRRRY